MLRIALLIVLSVGLLNSCKKDEDDPEPASTSVQQSTVQLALIYREGSSPVTAGAYIEDATGREVEVIRVRFLMSNFRFLNAAGNAVASFPDAVALFDSNDPSAIAVLGVAPYSSFASFQLDIGLSATTNAMDPTQFTGPPLTDQSLYLGSGMGYRFFAFEGRADADGDGIVESTEPLVSYTCATDAMLRTDQVFVSSSIAGSVSTLSIGMDIQGLLNGVNVMNDLNEVGASALSAQLISNLQTAVEPS